MRSLLRQSRPASCSGILVRRSGGIEALHSGTEARQDVGRRPLLVGLLASVQPCVYAGNSSRTVHPELRTARTHFPLVFTEGTWHREMGVVQSASCQCPPTSIGWRTRVPLRYFFRCMLWRLRRRSCASRSSRRCPTRRRPDWSAQLMLLSSVAWIAGPLPRKRSRVPDELPTTATIRLCSAPERTLALQPRLLRCLVGELIVKHRSRVGGAGALCVDLRSLFRSCANCRAHA